MKLPFITLKLGNKGLPYVGYTHKQGLGVTWVKVEVYLHHTAIKSDLSWAISNIRLCFSFNVLYYQQGLQILNSPEGINKKLGIQLQELSCSNLRCKNREWSFFISVLSSALLFMWMHFKKLLLTYYFSNIWFIIIQTKTSNISHLWIYTREYLLSVHREKFFMLRCIMVTSLLYIRYILSKSIAKFWGHDG